MKSFSSILIVVLVVVGLAFFLTREDTNSVSSTTVSGIFESIVDERNNVAVAVQPVNISQESPEWRFDIRMDTHSVELDHNLIDLVTLVDAQGKTYKPIAWQGSDAGGHHRENTLIFNPVTPFPETIEMHIEGIGGLESRIFRWRVN